MKKKVLAALLAGAMTVTLGACGGNTGSGNDTSKADDNTQGTTDTADVSKDAIRFMNTKIEIDGALKEFAKQYQEETGQEVVIESLGGGVDVNGQLKNYYAAGNMPDIFAFAADSYKSSFKDWLEPLDGESWIDDTDYAFKGEDGKVYGMPFALEGIGLAYNKDILDKAGVDPSALTNINAYKEAFEKIDSMKDELGITSVCAVAAESGQMYWSTGNHMMAAYISQGKDRTDKDIIDKLNKGEIDKDRMGQFGDWLQLLFDYSDQNVLISGTYDDQLALWATGKAAFITQGNWIDPSLPTYEAEFACGLAPAAFMEEDTDGIIVDAPAVWGIYNESDKIDACKEFLKALAESEEGQKALVEDCGMVSPYKSCTLEPSTPLAKSMLPYIKDGKTYAWDWLTQPEGIAQNATGAVFELYAKGQLDKQGFVDTMESVIKDYVASNGSNEPVYRRFSPRGGQPVNFQKGKRHECSIEKNDINRCHGCGHYRYGSSTLYGFFGQRLHDQGTASYCRGFACDSRRLPASDQKAPLHYQCAVPVSADLCVCGDSIDSVCLRYLLLHDRLEWDQI